MKKLKFVLFPLFFVVITLVFCACARAEAVKVPQEIINSYSIIGNFLRNHDADEKDEFRKVNESIQKYHEVSMDLGDVYKNENGDIVYEATEKQRQNLVDYAKSMADQWAFALSVTQVDPDDEKSELIPDSGINAVWGESVCGIACTKQAYQDYQHTIKLLDGADMLYQWLTTGNAKSRMQVIIVDGDKPTDAEKQD